MRRPHFFEPFLGAKTPVGMAFAEQSLNVLAVDLETLALPVRSVRPSDVRPLVPRQPKPSKRLENGLLRCLRRSDSVRILDAEEELAAMTPSEREVEESLVRRSYVRNSRG